MAQQPGPEIIEKLVITGVSPLGVQSVGSIYSVNQVLDSSDLAPQYGPSLARLLDSQLFSVSINDVTNNPFQPDVQYRGFTASPLLGLPQGLSVYLNGTRFNEPFGDTVNWDLLPTSALEQVSLVAGANPLFGQNTLGGALVLRSKNGFNFEQNKISLQAGDFGQQGINFESGGNNEEWAYYVNVNSYQEDGWRDYSDSEIKQLFSTISYQGDNHFSELTLAASDNRLIGNGAIPVELIPFEDHQPSDISFMSQPYPTPPSPSLFMVHVEGSSKLSDQMVIPKSFCKGWVKLCFPSESNSSIVGSLRSC